MLFIVNPPIQNTCDSTNTSSFEYDQRWSSFRHLIQPKDLAMSCGLVHTMPHLCNGYESCYWVSAQRIYTSFDGLAAVVNAVDSASALPHMS